ncbi:MAG: hypothetical protein AUI14_24055 [Actinobacteria bacterium 13_2_20CM_2_71_6]|nr:MAG: hypothetical protein AUI14_24055 [Actinobacteria bacterium 13_2_20CM_2_71_6]
MTPDEYGTLDLVAIAADDRLLDALGRGEPPPDGDGAALLLATWRAELAGDGDAPVDADDTIPIVTALRPGATADPDRADERDGTDELAAKRRTRQGVRRLVRPAVAAAAVLVLLGGGVAVAAANATPDSPLWPVTGVVNPQRANDLTADRVIAQARQAIADGRYADAQRLLDEAAGLVARIQDPQRAQRLRAELANLREAISTTGPARNGASTATPTPTPATARTPAPGRGAPASGTPGASSSPDGGLLPLPTPTLPGLPTGVLPSLPILGRLLPKLL